MSPETPDERADHRRRPAGRRHAHPAPGARGCAHRPRGRRHDPVHRGLPGLHHPHRLGRPVAAARAGPSRPQPADTGDHRCAAALGRVRAARARREEQRAVRRGDRRGDPARRGLRRRPGGQPCLQDRRADPRGAARRMTRGRSTGSPLLLAGVLLAGFNLRGAIAAVSPVLPDVRAELGLSPIVAGLLTALPVLCFAALAPAAAWFGRRLGPERAVLVGLATLTAATVLRVLDGAPVLLVGTFVIGAAMTVGNVLLPPVVKRDFGTRAGTVTGLYTATFAAGAAAAAALTAPIAGRWGWRIGLACWAALALVAAVVWALAIRGAPGRVPRSGGAQAGIRVWRLPLAWAVSGILALQSALYYAVTAWL